MDDNSPTPKPERPPPVFAVLAVILPVVFTVVPLYVGITDTTGGDFRLMIAMGYGMVGGAVGIVSCIVCAILSYSRKELYAPWAAPILFLPLLALLVLAFSY